MREKEQRREEILNAAEKLFFAKGYDDVSVNDIAGEAEVNKALLYYYFEDKKAVYLAIVLRAVRALHGMICESVKNSTSSVQEIHMLGTVYLSFASIFSDYHRVYRDFKSGRFNPGKEGASADFLEITRLQQEIVDITCDVMKAGQAEGVLTPDVKPLDAAVLTISICESLTDMSPGLKSALDERGINPQAYALEHWNFAYELLRGKRW